MKKILLFLFVFGIFGLPSISQNSDTNTSLTKEEILQLSSNSLSLKSAIVINDVAYIRSAISAPWGSNSNELALDAVFGAGMWDDLRFETVDPSNLFSSMYQFIFIEGGAENGPIMELFLNTNQALLEDWVSNGNCLLITGSSLSILGDLTLNAFGGFKFENSLINSNYVAASAPAHPIFNGPNLPVGISFSGSSFAHGPVTFSALSPDVLITDAVNSSYNVLVEFPWNCGTVMIGDITTTNFHAPVLEAVNLRKNMLDYLYNNVVVDVVPPVAVCKDITLQLEPDGTATITPLDVDGGSYDNCALASMEVSPNTFACDGATTLTLPTTVVRNFYARTVTFTNININGTGQNVLKVAPGDPVTVTADWASEYTNPTVYCPGCIQQFYLGVKDLAIDCMFSGNTYYSPQSGSGSIGFAAPSSPGLYVVQAAHSLQYSCTLSASNISDTQDGALGYILVVPEGTHDVTQVTLNVTDATGNSSSCSALVFIENIPTLTCPAIPTTISTGADDCEVTLAELGAPTVIDACDPDPVVVADNPGPFGLGEHTVTWTVTNEDGNSDHCTKTFTVVDDIEPTAVCQNIEVMLEPDGTYSIVPEDIDNGSSDNCDFELSASQLEFTCDDVGPTPVVLTVTDAGLNTDECEAIVTVLERPTTLTIDGDLSGQYSDQVTLSATLTDDDGDVPIEGEIVTLTFDNVDHVLTTDENGRVEVTITLSTQNPCDDFDVVAMFEHRCPYLPSEDTEVFDVLPEDASLEYTGTAISATESMMSNDFTVTLRGIVVDDPDGYPGDVSNAKARFLVDGSPVCDWLDVMLISSADPSVGMIEYDWASTLVDNPTTFDVQVELMDCFYTGTSIEYPLTVYNAVGDFITGGGHLIMTASADGFYAPDEDTKTNFGFNVKFNKNGKNLQGKMNIIFRRMEVDGMHTYQIKSNATTSLGTNFLDAETAIAEFVSKANLKDVTDPENPVSLGGNLTLHVTMTDKGEPGNMDMIGISLFDGGVDALLYSSNWAGTKTQEQLLDGGNIVVHSGAAFAPQPEPGDPVVEVPKGKGKNKSGFIPQEVEASFNTYPNPFSERLNFEFARDNATNAKLVLFDATGKALQVIFDQNINPKQNYQVEYVPHGLSTNILFYKMIFDDEIINGKVIYNK